MKTKELYNKLKALVTKIKSYTPVLHAQFWQFYYRYKNRFILKADKHGTFLIIIIFFALFIIILSFALKCNDVLDLYFSVQHRFNNFQTLLVTLGSALIGATAITFSLIMFAMQINIERMPYSLFKKFSSDLRLLSSFIAAFFIAIAITCSSMIPDKSWSLLAALGAIIGSSLILVIFLTAYRRALDLISPIKQIAILVQETKKHLEIWERASRRAAPLMKSINQEKDETQTQHDNHDIKRTAYYQLHPNWIDKPIQSIAICTLFSKRYAEQGDYEVSGAALNAILAINAAYIKVKGRTFFYNNDLIDNPLASDQFINNTLELLRQNIQVGISRRDEQQIEQIFRTMEQLCQIYLNIDYANKYATKTHAHLAAAYLTGTVENITPHNMPDVLMEGVRSLGNVAQLIIYYKEPSHIYTISEKIASIACIGAINKQFNPIAQIAVMQLAKLTFGLIRSQSNDVKHVIEKVRSNVAMIAKTYINTQDNPLSGIHSASLAPYYSGTSNDTLTSWLTDLTNTLLNTSSNHETALIIDHIVQWADNLYSTEKELLLLAIEKKSSFAFDIVSWILHITKLLLAISSADVCDEHDRNKLRNSAFWIISVLSWVPDEKEAVTFIENYQLTDSLFEAAIDAKQRECDNIALKIRDLLISWAFKAGKYETGFGILENACCGLACLNIIFELDNSILLNIIKDKIIKNNAPNLEIRLRVSAEIRKKQANVIVIDTC